MTPPVRPEPDDPLAVYRAFKAKHAKDATEHQGERFVNARPDTSETAGDRAAGLISAGYQGLTLGAGNKITAGIRTVLPEAMGGTKGFDFRTALREQTDVLDQERTRHPAEALVTELAGSLPLVLATGGAGALEEAPTVGGRLLDTMATGAGFGAASGAAESIRPDASIGDVGRGAEKGAAVGATLGPIVSKLGAPIVRGIARAGARLFPARLADELASAVGAEPVSTKGSARSAMRGALEAGGVDVGEAAKSTGLVTPPPGTRQFPANERTVTDFMQNAGIDRPEALRRLEAGGYDVSAVQPPVPMAGRVANDDIRRIANEYRQNSGARGDALPRPGAVDQEKAGVMAHAYEALKDDPNDPEVRAAYAAFAKETEAQAAALRAAGYRPEYMTDDPYANSADMMKDLAERKAIRVFKTNADNPHPLLTNEQNDLFRWVHDVFGHGQSGNQFGPLGEERAYRDHASMYSPLARRAMATETRGQNSWTNFGPNKDLPVTERPFAEQKAALMPPELTGDYRDVPRESPTSMMELGSRPAAALVRAARNVPTSTAAQETDRFLGERAAGAGERIKGAMTEATGHSGSTDTDKMVTSILQRGQAKARPLYEEAYNHGPIQDPETVAQIRDLRQHPVMARAWMRGQALTDLEAGKAPSAVAGISPDRMAELQAQGLDKFLPKEAASGPTVRQIDAWKKGLDAVIESGHGSDNALSKSEARVFRQRLNDVLAKVDQEVPAYGKARAAAGDYLRTRDAAEAGTKHFNARQDPETLARTMADMSPAEREAYRNTGLAEVAAKIREAAANEHLPEAGRSKNVLQSLMGTADASERLGMLFPDEKSFQTFLAQVEDEALYPKTQKFLQQQSSTAAQLKEGEVSAFDWRDLARAALTRHGKVSLLAKAASGAGKEGLSKGEADEIGRMATATGYRLRGLLASMAEDKVAREAGRQRLAALLPAVAGEGSAEADGSKKKLPPPKR